MRYLFAKKTSTHFQFLSLLPKEDSLLSSQVSEEVSYRACVIALTEFSIKMNSLRVAHVHARLSFHNCFQPPCNAASLSNAWRQRTTFCHCGWWRESRPHSLTLRLRCIFSDYTTQGRNDASNFSTTYYQSKNWKSWSI